MSKKKKNKKKRTYPRNTDTVIKKEIITTLDRGVIAHIENGIVTLRDKNGVPYTQSGIEMTKTYTGEKKTRVITKATELKTGSNNVAEWLKNFDVVYAADTNTKPIHNGKRNYSIGSVYKGEIRQTSENGGEICCKRYAAFAWVWSGDRKIENETWVRAMRKIQAEELDNKRIGFVIDSDLGNYEAYNNRTMPLLNEFYLPENFTLLYASSDYSDEWTNQMIKLCDKSASADLEKNISVAERINMDTLPEGVAIVEDMIIP